jgi:hypothetical protein
MSNKGKTNKNNLIKRHNLFKGDVPKKGIETIEVEGNTFKRTFDHMRKGYRYHPTKGFKKVWQSTQPLLMTSLLLQYGVAPLEM